MKLSIISTLYRSALHIAEFYLRAMAAACEFCSISLLGRMVIAFIGVVGIYLSKLFTEI